MISPLTGDVCKFAMNWIQYMATNVCTIHHSIHWHQIISRYCNVVDNHSLVVYDLGKFDIGANPI